MTVARFALLTLLLTSCASHIAPYRPKVRKFDPGRYASREPYSPNSLFASNQRSLFEDHIANRVGDMVIIRIDEQESASRNATSKLSKTNKTNLAVPASFGLLAKIAAANPGFDPAALFSSDSDSAFSGSGDLQRRGQLSATLPVRIREVMPNGDFFIEGTKVVMVGEEEHHIYLSGIVRQQDIDEDNTVASSRVAEAEIEYSGRGDVSDQQRQGWGTRTVGKVWPF